MQGRPPLSAVGPVPFGVTKANIAGTSGQVPRSRRCGKGSGCRCRCCFVVSTAGGRNSRLHPRPTGAEHPHPRSHQCRGDPAWRPRWPTRSADTMAPREAPGSAPGSVPAASPGSARQRSKARPGSVLAAASWHRSAPLAALQAAAKSVTSVAVRMAERRMTMMTMRHAGLKVFRDRRRKPQ